MGEFSSNHLTESERRVPIIGQISINGCVEYLGISDFHRTGRPFWDANLLDPRSSLGDSGTTTNQNQGVQRGGPYGKFSVM